MSAALDTTDSTSNRFMENITSVIDWIRSHSWRSYAGWFITSLSLIFLCLSIGKVKYYCFRDIPFQIAMPKNVDLDPLYYTEPVKLAVTQKLEGAKTTLQVLIGVMIVLWGMILTKKDEKVLLFNDKPEVISFISANILFFISVIFYIAYTSFMADVLTVGQGKYEGV